MLYFLKYSFVLILLVDLAITLPPIIMKLTSIKIDNDTRNILLILQFGYLCINALLLSVVLWIFGVSQEVLDASSLFQGIMILLLVLTFLFPYLSGWQREKKWRELLLETRHAWIEELLDILEFPTPSLFDSRLQMLSHRVKDCMEICESSQTTKSYSAYNQDRKAKRIKTIYMEAIKRNDPCASYIDFMKKFQENICECSKQLTLHRDNQAELIKLGRTHADMYRLRMDEIAKMMETERNSKPLLWIGLTTVLTTVLTILLTQIGNWLAPNITHLIPALIGGPAT
jgi:ABC-type multidrug transport system fused ATPase/permease subunit